MARQARRAAQSVWISEPGDPVSGLRLGAALRLPAAPCRQAAAAAAGAGLRLDDDVRLEYYRLQKISEGSIALGSGDGAALDGPTEVGSGAAHEEEVPLSRLIDIVNRRFGADFNEADQLFFDQIVEAAVADDELRQTAAVNPESKFELVFRDLIDRLFTERMDQNEEIFVRYMNEAPFKEVVTEWLASQAFRPLRDTDRAGGRRNRGACGSSPAGPWRARGRAKPSWCSSATPWTPRPAPATPSSATTACGLPPAIPGATGGSP